MNMRHPFQVDHNVVQQIASDWAQAGFRSQADAGHMADLIDELLHQRRHIALSCRDAELLDHYSRLLVRDLRQIEGVKVIPYFPSSTEVLLSRLNEMLAHLSVRQAMEREGPADQPLHVFVLHDTASLANAELALLVQLINDLPGTRLRLVLVLDSEDHQHLRLPLLGKRGLHWDIPAPATAAHVVPATRAVRPGDIPVLQQSLPGESPATDEAPRRALDWLRRLGKAPTQWVSGAATACLTLVLTAFLGLGLTPQAQASGPRWQAGRIDTGVSLADGRFGTACPPAAALGPPGASGPTAQALAPPASARDPAAACRGSPPGRLARAGPSPWVRPSAPA